MICDCGRDTVLANKDVCQLCRCELTNSGGLFCGAWFCRGWFSEAAEAAPIESDLDDFTPSQGSHQRDPMRGEVWLHPRNKRDEVRDG